MMNTKKENRAVLVNYLTSGKPLAEFDMQWYSDTGAEWDDIWEENCGSVGCVVGHSTLIGFTKLRNENYFEYALRLFCDKRQDFEWLFGAGWHLVDNTMEGAAKRILYLDNFGLPAISGSEAYVYNKQQYFDLIARVDELVSKNKH
jgi:hypothetical protein